MSLTAHKVGDKYELHDEDLGIHMFTASPGYGRGRYNVKHTKEAERYFPLIGSHPDLQYRKSLSDVNKANLAETVSVDYNSILRKGGKPNFEYKQTSSEKVTDKYGGEHYNHTHDVYERKTGRRIGVVHSTSRQETAPHPMSFDSAKLKLDSDFSKGVNLEALNAKVSNHLRNPLEHMAHIVDMADSLRGKQPSFIGTIQNNSGTHKEFSTHLEPEEASRRYEEHMRKAGVMNFVRHSPTHFEYISGYGNDEKHNVMSTPGRIIHTKARLSDYEKTKNAELYESVLMERVLETLTSK